MGVESSSIPFGNPWIQHFFTFSLGFLHPSVFERLMPTACGVVASERFGVSWRQLGWVKDPWTYSWRCYLQAPTPRMLHERAYSSTTQ